MKALHALFVLPLIGFGCINVQTSATAEGGLWRSDDQGETWTSTSAIPTASGVGSFGNADVSVIVFDAADEDALYAGTVENGFLFSYDNGGSWQRPGEALTLDGFVHGIAVDPRDKCTVYAAIGARVMKSTDCNRTYDTESFVESAGKSVVALELDWYSPDTVWAATTAGDVVKSTNGGESWTTVERVNDKITALLVDNSDSRVVLVATEDEGLWRTTDGGESWSELTSETRAWSGSEKGYAFAQNGDGSMIYYANRYGLLRSIDHGATWEALTLLTAPSSVFIRALAVDPDDGNVVYYGTSNTFYVTTDGGSNWSTNELPSDRAATAITIDPNESSTIFLGVARVDED